MEIKINKLFNKDGAGLMFGLAVDWEMYPTVEVLIALGVILISVSIPIKRKVKDEN